jgi:hypothetical protein
MSATPEEIAKRLTKAQKAALLWLPADGSARQWFSGVGNQEGHKQLRSEFLANARVDRRSCIMNRWATEEGLLVRAELEKELHHGEG